MDHHHTDHHRGHHQQKHHQLLTPSQVHEVPIYALPPDASVSLWHHVDIRVRTWLDQDTGLYRYINEIPRGALQKFELQTTLPHNVIREDAKGSKKLRQFGRPVPFNYGCFPQTFRDPKETDDIYGAGGDDDPLDVVDLCDEAVGVGQIMCCRPLGAVCLIDEGQADWKVLVVNTEASSPLAMARSVEEAERIAPGRVQEVLRWIDGLKSGGGEGQLQCEVHDADRAVQLIERDHAAWRRLIENAGHDGTAHGHWIRVGSSATAHHRPQTSHASLHVMEHMHVNGNRAA